MSERDALERIRAELKQKIDILIDNAIDQIEKVLRQESIVERIKISYIEETEKEEQKRDPFGKVGKNMFEKSESSSTDEEENGSQVLDCIWSTSISESPLQQKSMDTAKHTPEKEKLVRPREKSSSVDSFVSPILTKRSRLSMPSSKTSLKQKVKNEGEEEKGVKKSESGQVNKDIQKAKSQPSLSNVKMELISTTDRDQQELFSTQERSPTPNPEGESMYDQTIARQFSKSFACVTPIRKKTTKRTHYEIPKEGTPPQFWDLQINSSPH